MHSVSQICYDERRLLEHPGSMSLTLRCQGEIVECRQKAVQSCAGDPCQWPSRLRRNDQGYRSGFKSPAMDKSMSCSHQLLEPFAEGRQVLVHT